MIITLAIIMIIKSVKTTIAISLIITVISKVMIKRLIIISMITKK